MATDYKQKARDLFLQGFNCSQAVFGAFAKDYDIPMNLALRLSASFGGGIGRMRETCGALCGACMIAGLETGQTEESDQTAKQKNYETVQHFFSEFGQRNGSTRCAELLRLRAEEQKSHPSTPAERTDEYYHSRPCLRMVECAVDIVEEYLKNKI